jgi:RecA-family ATPase
MKKYKDVNELLMAEGDEAVRRLFEALDEEPSTEKPISVPNLTAWLSRELPEPDFLCGTWLSTTSRVLITGPTGLGKTMLAVALGIYSAASTPFLHWPSGRKARVLYVDGEMSRREMKRRLTEEAARLGAVPDTLFILSKEDFEGMPPLNAPEGQEWMNDKMDEIKPDLAIFDNIQSLVAGDHGKEESWSPVLPWVRLLTKKQIAQVWLHHTGHNEQHSYGTKTREWQMDTCILLKRTPERDKLQFTLEFTKARERTPTNHEEFDDVTITLEDNRWLIQRGASSQKMRTSDKDELAFRSLERAICDAGEKPPASNHIPPNIRVAAVSMWKAYHRKASVVADGEEDKWRKNFERSLERLVREGRVATWDGWAWLVK